MSERAEIDKVDLPTTLTDKLLLNFRSNLTSLRFLIMNFTLKYSENNDFLGYFFVLSRKSAVFRDFPCFPFCPHFP